MEQNNNDENLNLEDLTQEDLLSVGIEAFKQAGMDKVRIKENNESGKVDVLAFYDSDEILRQFCKEVLEDEQDDEMGTE